MSWDGRGGSDLAQHHARVGFELQERGDLEGALRHYGRAAEEFPNFPGLHRQRGWLHYQRGDFQAALSDLSVEIELDPGDLSSVEYRAKVRLALDDFEGALKDYSWLVARTPDPSRAYCLRASAYSQSGILDRALDDGSFAIEIDSRNADAYVTRGWILLRRGEVDLAVADARRALTLDKKNVRANQFQGRLYLVEGKLEEARERFGRAIKGGWPELSVAVVLYLEGRLKEARDRFERSIADCWNNPELRDTGSLLLWLCRRALGQGEEADSGLRTAMERPSPRPADWTGRIAAFLLGDLPEAAFRAAAVSPSPALRAEREAQAAFHIGLRRKLAGDGAGAARAFQDCVESKAVATYEWVLARGERASG
ncbi:MAG TPA: tetratricopeptide repeat protein [Planctomycetota bacterium]|nr:tetratricopeptide repeat protein [Planctomycetota bacterium]